jgi:hypothetical protein
MSGARNTYGGEEMYAGCWFGTLMERDHLEDSGVDGSIILMWIFKKGMGPWTGLIWLRIGTDGGLL